VDVGERVAFDVAIAEIGDGEDALDVLVGRDGGVGARRRFVDIDDADRKALRRGDDAVIGLQAWLGALSKSILLELATDTTPVLGSILKPPPEESAVSE